VERRDVWILAFDGMQALDLTGPHSVLAAANEVLRARGAEDDAYVLRVVGRGPGSITTNSGLGVVVEPLPDPALPPHTLIVPGGSGTEQAARDAELVDWLGRVGAGATRVACVCTGPFLAAAAGLLAGRRVTTHWRYAERLAATFPDLDVRPDSIWERDGDTWTSAGVTAGIDLALAIVEDDHGVAISQRIARELVVFLRRPGGQSQFAAPAWQAVARTPPVRRAQELVDADPGRDHSLDALARAVGLSPRHLARRFTAEVGVSPAKYVERVRVVAARNHLEQSAIGLDALADRCGFGTAETLRRTFQRHVGVPPDQYRRRFGRPTSQDQEH
jgi:transcriptional regulator GlxA family with amidase domain